MFKPKLIPTLVTVPCLLMVIALGCWQVQRLQWKEALLANLSEELSSPPKPLDDDMLRTPLERFRFRHVNFDASLPAHTPATFAAKYYKGSLGYNVVSAAQLPSGGEVLVNRGWIPQAMRDSFLMKESKRDKPEHIQVEGMMRALPPQGLFVPNNTPKDNMWFWYDAPALKEALGMQSVPSMVVDATRIEPAANYPMTAKAEITLRNDHLMYALTWFGLALALAVIYVVYHLQLEKRPKSDD
ncbi:hypothetical protein GC177_08410 [bacterium]|nr:hypothetical protein [bacterium]